MAGKTIMRIVSFGCTILFFSIGIYVQKPEKNDVVQVRF